MIAVDRKQKILWALLAAFVIVKILIAMQPHPVMWDEAVYAGMGKFLYSGGQAGLWEEIMPTGLPLILGAVWKSGLPFAATAEIMLAVMAAGTIWLTYQTARKLSNEGTAAFSALLVAGTAIFFRQSSLFMAEMPATLMLMLAIYLASGRKTALSSAAAGIAAMLKFTNVLILPALLLVPAIEYIKNKDVKKLAADSAKTLLPFAAIIATFLTVNYIAYGSALEPVTLASAHQSNPAEATTGFLNNLLFYIVALLKQNVFFAFLPAGIFIAIREMRNPKNAALLSYLGIFAAYFTLIANKQERFALLFMPAAAIFAAHGFYRTLLMNKGTTIQGMLLSGILLIAAGFTAYSIAAADISYFNERRNAELPDYSWAGRGKVLSSEPHAAYYTDNRVIPYYFSTADGKEGIMKAAERFNENLQDSMLIYKSENFYCTPDDAYCNEQLSFISAQK
jgi:hypothetical protein